MSRLKIKIYLLCINILFLIVPRSTPAQEEVFLQGSHFGVGARAMGLGGAFLAVAEDYGATYWNPAGLAQIRRMEFLCSMSHLITNDKATFSGIVTPDKSRYTKLNSLGFVFPVPTYRGSLVFAVGYNRTQTFDFSFSFDWFNPTEDDSVQQSWSRAQSGGMSNWVLSGAIDVTPKLSLGGSLNIWRGGNNNFRTFEVKDNLDLYYFKYYILERSIDGEYSAINFKLGGLYRMTEHLRLGATIATPISFKADEDWSWKERQFEDADTLSRNASDSFPVSYKIRSPFSFSVGASFVFLNLLVSGDIEYNDWSQITYRTDPPFTKVNGYDSTKAEINRDIRKKYQPTTRVRLGAEFTIPFLDTKLRAGFFRDPSPFKNADIENDKKFFTVGAGFLLDKQVMLDLTWVHGWWQKKNEPWYEDIPEIVEDIKVDKFFVTAAFRF